MDSSTIPNNAPKPSVHPAMLFGINFCLWVVLVHAVAAVLDDLLFVWDRSQWLAPVRWRLLLGNLGVSAALALLQIVYPRFRDRTLVVWIFILPATLIVSVLPSCFWPEWLPLLTLFLSVIALGVLAIEVRLLTGAWNWKWTLVTQDHVHVNKYTWKMVWKQIAFMMLVIAPLTGAMVAWVGICLLERDTGGCLSIHKDGVVVHVVDYQDPTGKRVRLLPMVHFGDAAFYQKVSRDFTQDSTVLMEGLRDRKGICKNFMRSSEWVSRFGMVEQGFDPTQSLARFINADLDVSDFSPFTIDALQKDVGGWVELRWFLIMAHPGYRFERLRAEHLDILSRRNQQVMKVLKKYLERGDYFVIPWGAAHMPGLAANLEQLGFQRGTSEEYQVMKWGK